MSPVRMTTKLCRGDVDVADDHVETVWAAPRKAGSVENEYWVLARQTGSLPCAASSDGARSSD